MGNVNGDTHVGEVEAVAQPDQGQGDNVVQDQLLEILAWLLQHQQQDQGLLSPVTGLQQVVGLEQTLVGVVREILEHASRVEVPDGGSRHDIQAEWTVDAKVHGRVELLHEARLLGAALDSPSDGQWTDESLHEELAGEAEDDSVEGHKGEIGLSLSIVNWFIGGSVCHGAVKRV